MHNALNKDLLLFTSLLLLWGSSFSQTIPYNLDTITYDLDSNQPNIIEISETKKNSIYFNLITDTILSGGSASFNYDTISVKIDGNKMFKNKKIDLTTEFRELLVHLKGDDLNPVKILVDGNEILEFTVSFIKDVADDDLNSSTSEICKLVDYLSLINSGSCASGTNKLDRENFFGEQNTIFPKHQITYILDYQPDRNEHQFYKIYYKEGKLKAKRRETIVKHRAMMDGYQMLVIPNFSKERLPAGKSVQFKILNINRFRYNVAISSDQVRFNSEPNSLFNNYFIGDNDKLLGTLIEQTDAFVKARSGPGDNQLNKIQRLKDDIQCLYKANLKLKSYFYKIYAQCQRFSCCDELLDSEILFKMEEHLLKINNIIDDLIMSIPARQNTVKKLKADCELKTSLEEEKEEIEKRIIILTSESRKLRGKALKAKQKLIEEAIKMVDDKTSEIQKINCNSSKILELEEEIELYNKLDRIKGDLPTKNDFLKLSLLLNSMNSYANQYVKTIPQLREARLDLGFYIEPKDTVRVIDMSVTDLKSDSTNHMAIDSIKIPIIHHFSISFSTGPFIGYGDKLTPSKYNFRPLPGSGGIIEDPSRYQLVKSGSAELPLGLSALMNLQFQFDKGFAGGLSAGVGLSIQKNPKPAYLGGVSLMLGHKRQIVITWGTLITKVSEFDNTLYGGDVIYTDPTAITINYNSVVRQGYFFSLTYTPFKEIKL